MAKEGRKKAGVGGGSAMLQLDNKTPFQAGIAVFPGADAIDTLILTIKGTFAIKDTLGLADEQAPLAYADEYWGEAGRSSLKYAAEVHLAKPATDVVMNGHAQVPGQRPVTQLEVLLSVGNLKKIVRVFGNRRWTGGFLSPKMTRPAPFETMPLVYERAFGGTSSTEGAEGGREFEPRNPVGRGFIGKGKGRDPKDQALPNLEDPSHLISGPTDCPPPAGFGYLAPSWIPRRAFAGTYDESWQKTRAPYLPRDFNPRFFNAAHPDLVCRGYLTGGEPVQIVNASPQGPLRFSLPKTGMAVTVWNAGEEEKPAPRLETVLIEPDESRVLLIWRAVLPCPRGALKVSSVGVSLERLDLA
jgi:hypothetical protein